MKRIISRTTAWLTSLRGKSALVGLLCLSVTLILIVTLALTADLVDETNAIKTGINVVAHATEFYWLYFTTLYGAAAIVGIVAMLHELLRPANARLSRVATSVGPLRDVDVLRSPDPPRGAASGSLVHSERLVPRRLRGPSCLLPARELGRVGIELLLARCGAEVVCRSLVRRASGGGPLVKSRNPRNCTVLPGVSALGRRRDLAKHRRIPIQSASSPHPLPHPSSADWSC